MRRCKKTEEREGQARRAPRCQASAYPGRGGGRETEQPSPAEPPPHPRRRPGRGVPCHGFRQSPRTQPHLPPGRICSCVRAECRLSPTSPEESGAVASTLVPIRPRDGLHRRDHLALNRALSVITFACAALKSPLGFSFFFFFLFDSPLCYSDPTRPQGNVCFPFSSLEYPKVATHALSC